MFTYEIPKGQVFKFPPVSFVCHQSVVWSYFNIQMVVHKRRENHKENGRMIQFNHCSRHFCKLCFVDALGKSESKSSGRKQVPGVSCLPFLR